MVMTLEVGKSYIDSEPFVEGETSFTDIIPIVGEVIPGTIEYEKGYRFFSQQGLFYTPEGETFLECDCGSTHSIGRPLTPKDLLDGYVERYRRDPQTCEGDPNFISRNDPEFKLILGNSYINRMGFVILLDELVYPEDGEILFAAGQRTPWLTTQGGPMLDVSSMFDLLYQRR